MLELHGAAGYRRRIYVDAGNARLWVEEEGSGPAALFLHGGLGDSRLWTPVTDRLRDSFRCIRYDSRFFGRSEAPNEEWSPSEDAVAVLDALDVERAAVVGLSMGGRVALEVALTHPERVSALVHVAGAVEPFELEGYDPGDTRESEMLADFGVWAPLGVEEGYRDLWLATPADTPKDRRADVHLDDLTVPTLVVIAKHDPEVFRELAERIPATRRVVIDSDHYLTLREPDAVARLIREFLTA